MLTIHTKTVEALRCYNSFSYFAQRAWGHIDPAPLVWGWHAQAICDHLQAITDGRMRKLIINIPPGHAKSMLVSVLWPAWGWVRNPQWRALFSSYDGQLVNRDAVRARTLMRSDWFQELFCGKQSALLPRWGFQSDQDQKSYYENSLGGFRIGVTVGGGITGKRGNCVVIDDPLKAGDAHSELVRNEVIRWHKEDVSTRYNDPRKAIEVIIMQRLHEDDLTGHLLRAGGYQHLCLPTEFESARRSVTYTLDGQEFWRDPRTEEGELLFPQLFDRAAVEGLKARLGSFGYSGQHQQNPIPAKGGMLQREWFSNLFDLDKVPHFDKVSIFVDASFKGGKDNDRVAIGVFGRHKANAYLLDMIWKPMGFGDTMQAMRDILKKWPQVRGVYIEDKANGPAIIDQLKTVYPGVIPMLPEGGKEARVAAIAPFIEGGNLWLPRNAPWLDAFISECVSFPRGSHDDALDMVAYALRHLLVSNDAAMFRALVTM